MKKIKKLIKSGFYWGGLYISPKTFIDGSEKHIGYAAYRTYKIFWIVLYRLISCYEDISDVNDELKYLIKN